MLCNSAIFIFVFFVLTDFFEKKTNIKGLLKMSLKPKKNENRLFRLWRGESNKTASISKFAKKSKIDPSYIAIF